MYLIRDEPRTRTARSSRHTLVTAYQFANSSISEQEFTSKAVAVMEDNSGEYDWLGLEPTAKLLEVETASDYFPHFSQVTTPGDTFLQDLLWQNICAVGNIMDANRTMFIQEWLCKAQLSFDCKQCLPGR